MTDSNSRLVDSTVCLIVSYKRPGVKRKISAEHFEAEDADKALVGAQKKIVDCPEYGKVATFEGHVKNFLITKSLPSKLYRNSTFLITRTAMRAVDAFLESARPQWQELVDAYVAAYPEAFVATSERLGRIANPSDRMTEEQLREAFSFHFEYVALSTPSSLKQVSAEIFEREEQRLRERLQTAEQDIMGAFRVQFAGMVAGMKAMLDGTDTKGVKQRFSGWRIKKLEDFIAQFKGESNVCGDAALTELMDEASKLLAGVDPNALKKSEDWRKNISTEFAAIIGKLGELTRVKGTRFIDVDDDEPEPDAPAEEVTT